MISYQTTREGDLQLAGKTIPANEANRDYRSAMAEVTAGDAEVLAFSEPPIPYLMARQIGYGTIESQLSMIHSSGTAAWAAFRDGVDLANPAPA